MRPPSKPEFVPDGYIKKKTSTNPPPPLGGRTAWSSQVTIYNQTHSARFWYDGKNLHNAREDAAEVAWNWLTTPSSSPSTSNTASW